MHSGSGEVFNPDAADPAAVPNCPKKALDRRLNQDSVKVTVDTGLSATDYKLNCVGLNDAASTNVKRIGMVKLINNQRTITCTIDLPATRTDFQKPIDISVDFSYDQTVDKEVLVKHLIDSAPAAAPPSRCGNGVCDVPLGETTASCPVDCP